MRRRVKNIDYLQRLVDLIIVYVSWLFAYFLRFVVELGGDPGKHGIIWYVNFGLLLALVSMITFKNSKLYDAARMEDTSKELAMQLKANAVAFIAFLVLAFFVADHRISRILLVIYFLVSSMGLIWSKLWFRNKLSKVASKYIMVGNGEVVKKYYDKIKNIPNLQILYWVDAPEGVDEKIPRKEALDYYQLEGMGLDGLVIGYDNTDSEKASQVLQRLAEFIVPIIVLPDVSYARVGYSVGDFKGQPLIYINEPNIKQLGLIFKRVFDFTAAFLGSLVISPILAMIAILVKTTSRGPIFYGQVRMGVDGKEFKMWKFRSMVTGQANPEGWTVKDDPRVTRVGKFLRKTSLDELPQLWNVIVGDMSLVGPRPERPQYVEEFRKEIPGYMIRHKFKAGITGWAQINGWRGDTSIEKRIECDLWYIKNWSFWLDISILFMTVWKGFVNKNAY